MVVFLFCLFVTTPPDQAGEFLRNRVEGALAQGDFRCGASTLLGGSFLVDLYGRNNFTPLWRQANILALRKALAQADQHGLDPNDYHLDQLDRLHEKQQKTGATDDRLATDLELLAGDAYLLYAFHLQSGRNNAEGFDPHWHIERRENDLVAYLLEAAGKGRINESLQALAPQDEDYRRLQKALALWRQRERDPSWEQLEPGPLLKPGMRHPQIQQLRQRFLPEAPPSELYDPALVQQITDVQRRHFLEPDGFIGDQTREVLNRTPRRKSKRSVPIWNVGGGCRNTLPPTT